MKIVAVNGSPRKKGNTATILQHVLDGAKQANDQVETQLVHLYTYQYTGCKSCFACKLKNGKSYGKCALKDDITPILEELPNADAIVFGSPIYFSELTGMMRCFLERLLFPIFTYTENWGSLAPKKVRTAFVYTMNLTKPVMEEWGYPERFQKMESVAGHLFGIPSEVLSVYNTVQFNDYSKYVCTVFSEEEKKQYRATQFPIDCQKAEELGARLIAE
ncbi:MAG: flavodoxin family protein [Desulfovibrionaceae bacterium]|nr:flavodoxin family protein [Desulfovibrionaceae bacterium]